MAKQNVELSRRAARCVIWKFVNVLYHCVSSIFSRFLKSSADRTVKFWDLETFELIGSARCEATGVCSIAFHSDGRTLFAGLEDSLKVYSWDPIICHDAVDMGWTALGDLCIHDEKILGCSYYRNSIGIWVADILVGSAVI
ncbi:hypothetical protein K1719_026546 [Acacia pycnantha]|nr:hypothetical protein K1719_026546 [Acacia pycnantha]